MDRRELQREGPSYTVDTLAAIRRELGPRTPVAWVLGMDALAGLASWHDWKRLLQLAHLVAIERPGAPVQGAWLAQAAPEVHAEIGPRMSSPAGLSSTPAGAFVALPMHPLRPESATQVRQGIASGRDWDHLVPAAVAAYIRRHGLYGAPPQP